MSPVASLKRHSTEDSCPKASSAAKRAKIFPTTSKFLTTRKMTLLLAAANIAEANALDSDMFIINHIPAERRSFLAKDGCTYSCEFRRTQDLHPSEFEACFDIVKKTSQADYESNAEEGWDEAHKRKEMAEEGMRFILIRRQNPHDQHQGDNQEKSGPTQSDTPAEALQTRPVRMTADKTILGFTSFVLELDPDNSVPQIYIYEIHLLPALRGLGLGKHLMALNEAIAKNIRLEKSILTVFTCNERAEDIYRALGYEEDDCCPQTRRLRGGKIRRPKYLILSKSLV